MAPDRYIPCQLTWLSDPRIAADEIYRNAERGFRAVSFSENPEGLGFPNVYQPYWEPFFAACEETQTVINLHVGSSGTTRKGVRRFPRARHCRTVSAEWNRSAHRLGLRGVLVRHPGRTVALSEAGASWVPMALERLAVLSVNRRR